MFVAQHKRKENIAEYILYMWQVEDLIRANGLDFKRLTEMVIEKYQVTEAVQRDQLLEWYDNLTEMMRLEQKEKAGHLQITMQLMHDLQRFHVSLLDQSAEIRYHNAFQMAYSDLRAFAGKVKGAETMHEVELGLTALYSAFMLRLRGTELGSDTEKALQRIGKFLGLLSAKYLKAEQEG